MSSDIEREDEDLTLEGEAPEGVNADERDSDIYPTEVRIGKDQYSTTHLKTLVEKRKTLVIDPDFQRDHVWSVRQSSELVESILMGIPIPVIYLFEMKDGTRQMVDGRQRTTAILDYLNDKFELRDLKILKTLNGSKFSDLDPKLQGNFEDYQLNFYIIQPPTLERVKYDIFDRVNRGGTKLNAQEMRNALYRGTATKMLDILANSDEFKDAVQRGVDKKRKKDEYIILRAISLHLYWTRPEIFRTETDEAIEYRGDMDEFLAKSMIFFNNPDNISIVEDYKRLFLESMSLSYQIMGEDAFRFRKRDLLGSRRPINMSLFEVMMYIFSSPQIFDHKDIVKEKVNEFKTELDIYQTTAGNPDSSYNIRMRYQMADEVIKDISSPDPH